MPGQCPWVAVHRLHWSCPRGVFELLLPRSSGFLHSHFLEACMHSFGVGSGLQWLTWHWPGTVMAETSNTPSLRLCRILASTWCFFHLLDCALRSSPAPRLEQSKLCVRHLERRPGWETPLPWELGASGGPKLMQLSESNPITTHTLLLGARLHDDIAHILMSPCIVGTMFEQFVPVMRGATLICSGEGCANAADSLGAAHMFS